MVWPNWPCTGRRSRLPIHSWPSVRHLSSSSATKDASSTLPWARSPSSDSSVVSAVDTSDKRVADLAASAHVSNLLITASSSRNVICACARARLKVRRSGIKTLEAIVRQRSNQSMTVKRSAPRATPQKRCLASSSVIARSRISTVDQQHPAHRHIPHSRLCIQDTDAHRHAYTCNDVRTSSFL